MPYLYITIYFVLISLISVITCVVDKIAAKRDGWRISEKTLFILCFLGGSVAMYATMRLIRHKTLHKRFMLGIPLIIALQLVLILGVISRM